MWNNRDVPIHEAGAVGQNATMLGGTVRGRSRSYSACQPTFRATDLQCAVIARSLDSREKEFLLRR
jgi:hypothetical protein